MAKLENALNYEGLKYYDGKSKEYINEVINTIKTATGTSIVATDSAKGYATDFSCVGNVEQKQYSGKNLLNNTATTQTIGGITFTVNADGSITANGTNTGNVELYLIPTSNEEILPAGDYILSGCPSGGSTSTYVLDGRITNYYADTGSGKSFTLTEETAIGYIRILIYANANPKNLTFYPMIRKSTADATYEPYTGGTPSPNPSYPQAIMNSGDCVEMENGSIATATGEKLTSSNRVRSSANIPCKKGDTICLKTEFTPSIKYLYFYNEKLEYLGSYDLLRTGSDTMTVSVDCTHFKFALGGNGDLAVDNIGKIELTVNDKYVLQVKSENKNGLKFANEGNRNRPSHTYTTESAENITVKIGALNTFFARFTLDTIEGQTYVYSGESSNEKYSVFVYDDELWGNRLTSFFADATDKTFTATKTGTYVVGLYVGNSNFAVGDTQQVINPMFRPVGTDDTYVPHKESTSTILLDEPPRAVNDVKDVIEYIDDGYKVRRRLNARIFNGSESWATSTPTKSGLYRYDVYISDTSRKSYSAMCSHFVMSSATTSFADNVTEVSFAVHPTNGNFCFFTEFATLDDWKTWLASNPITVQYEMAEEVIEDIADQTPFYQIQTYDGGTTISTTDRLQPQIEVEYPTNRVSGVASEALSDANTIVTDINISLENKVNKTDVIPVVQGGTGATTLTSGQALIGNGTDAVTTRAITSLTSQSHLNYSSSNNTNLTTLATLAFWNGRYSSTASNLAYCNKGAFGDMATKTASDYSLATHTHNYAGSSSAGGAATSALKLSNTAAIGSATQPVYFNASGVPVATTYTLGKSVPSDAVFTDNDYRVSIVETNPSTGTWYYPTFHSATSGTQQQLKANDGLRYYSQQGTASVTGRHIISVGNNIASGIAGNKYGEIWIYSNNTEAGNITQSATTTRVNHVLPATSGTILNTGTTSFTRSLSSGTKIGAIKINGTSTDIYAPAYSLPTANASTKGGVTLTDSYESTSGASSGVAASGLAVSNLTSGLRNWELYKTINVMQEQSDLDRDYYGGLIYVYKNEALKMCAAWVTVSVFKNNITSSFDTGNNYLIGSLFDPLPFTVPFDMRLINQDCTGSMVVSIWGIGVTSVASITVNGDNPSNIYSGNILFPYE